MQTTKDNPVDDTPTPHDSLEHGYREMLEQPAGYEFSLTAASALAPHQRLHLILLGVDDVARARHFYEALGWAVSPRSDENFVRVNLGGYALCLLSRAAFSQEVFGSPITERPKYSGLALAHLVARPEDVAAVLRQALNAGAELVKPVTRTPWGVNAFFKDPDGHLFEIDYEATWALDDQHQLLVDR